MVRRQVLRLLFGVALGALPLSCASARSGGNGGGNGNSGNGNSGNGNSGNGNSGNGNSGKGNSGNGNSGNGNSGNGNSGGNNGKSGEKGSKSGGQAEAGEETVQDQDRARRAVEEGRALPLSSFLPRIERRFGGRVIDAALREVGKRLLYDLKLLSPGGRVFTVSVDAATGRPRGGIGM